MSNKPTSWVTKKLGDICLESQYGLNCPATGGKYPILGMKNLNGGKIKVDDLAFVDLTFEEMQKFRLNHGDLLINRTNSLDLVGKSALFDLQGDYVFASYLVRFIIDRSAADPLYVNFYCNSHIGISQMQRLATKGVSQANINPTELKKNFRIPIPPLSEQRKIAEVLSTWDEAIVHTERLIIALQQRKKGFMQRLLTGEVRFPGLDGEWREVKLGDIFIERIERGFDNLPLLSISEYGITYRDESNRRDKSSEDKSKYLRICSGDIGYNTMRMWQGRSALSQYEGIVSPAYTILKPKKSIDVRYMAYLFKYRPMIHTFSRYSQGLVSDTWSLKYPAFAKIHVKIPSTSGRK